MRRTFLTIPKLCAVTILLMSSVSVRAAGPQLTTTGRAARMTQDQRDYLQSTMDALSSMGRDDLANRLNNDVQSGRAVFGDCGNGTMATVNAPLGYLSRASSNKLTIDNAGFQHWVDARNLADKAAKKGRQDLVDKGNRNAMDAANSIALTLTHEYVHMDQYAPQQIPKDEDPAYTHGISEMQRVIRDRMRQIREIMDRNANQPGDAEKLKGLLDDLKSLRDIYDVSVNSMYGDDGVIEQGHVTKDTFKDAQADKDKLVKEVNDLIKNAQNSQPSAGNTGASTPANQGNSGTTAPPQSTTPSTPLLPDPNDGNKGGPKGEEPVTLDSFGT